MTWKDNMTNPIKDVYSDSFNVLASLWLLWFLLTPGSNKKYHPPDVEDRYDSMNHSGSIESDD